MSFYWLVLGILGVWRITHLLYAEDGPWNVMVRLRRRAGHGLFGAMLDCFYCMSLWIAVPFAWYLGGTISEQILLWPALSAGAILLERLTSKRVEPPPAPYVEDPEDDHVMLRQQENG